MSWRDAPLYVQSRDLAAWVMERAARWTGAEGDRLGRDTHAAARDLVEACALALTFPARRGDWLEAADVAALRLRERLRLAALLGLLSRRQLRFVDGRLAEVGRMIGGWRKRHARRARGPPDT